MEGHICTITAFFDSRTDAEEAVQRLHSAGFAPEAVRMVAGHHGSPERNVNRDSDRNAYENNEGVGFWKLSRTCSFLRRIDTPMPKD